MNTNLFLQVNKDLFNLKEINPLEMLIISQIMEFDRNKRDCYITNEQLAENFHVSTKTISRALNHLEDELHYIKRDTKTVEGKRIRYMKVNYEIINAATKETKCPFEKVDEKDKMSLSEETKCPFQKGQNDSIKDNRKDNIKDNNSAAENSLLTQAFSSTERATKEEAKIIEVSYKPSIETRKFKF